MGHIDFPPVKALSFRGGVSMMVVVPTLSPGDHSQKEAVAAGVTGPLRRGVEAPSVVGTAGAPARQKGC